MNELPNQPEPKSAVRRGRPPTKPPPEPSQEEQLKSVMEQIKMATGAVGPHMEQPPHPPPSAPMSTPDVSNPTPPATPPAPIVPAAPPRAFQLPAIFPDIKAFDVVQIMNRESRLYGILFIVGDIDGQRVHGFYFNPGGKKEFVTVNVSELTHNGTVAFIGESRVRAREACSSKWLMDHGKPNNL